MKAHTKRNRNVEMLLERSINSLIGQLKIINNPNKGVKITKILAIVNLILLIPTIGLALIIYTKGTSFLVDRLIDFQQQTELYIKQAHWDDAEYALNKYKEKKGGRIEINYYSIDELDRLLEILMA